MPDSWVRHLKILSSVTQVWPGTGSSNVQSRWRTLCSAPPSTREGGGECTSDVPTCANLVLPYQEIQTLKKTSQTPAFPKTCVSGCSYLVQGTVRGEEGTQLLFDGKRMNGGGGGNEAEMSTARKLPPTPSLTRVRGHLSLWPAAVPHSETPALLAAVLGPELHRSLSLASPSWG